MTPTSTGLRDRAAWAASEVQGKINRLGAHRAQLYPAISKSVEDEIAFFQRILDVLLASPAPVGAEGWVLVDEAEAACVSLRAEVLSREHIDAQVEKIRRLLASLRGEPRRVHQNDPYIRRADIPGLPLAGSAEEAAWESSRATPPAEAREMVERLTRERDDAKDDALRLHREKMEHFEARLTAETEAKRLKTYIQPMLDALLEAADKFTVFFYDFKDGSPEKEVCDRNRKLCMETFQNYRAALSASAKTAEGWR